MPAVAADRAMRDARGSGRQAALGARGLRHDDLGAATGASGSVSAAGPAASRPGCAWRTARSSFRVGPGDPPPSTNGTPRWQIPARHRCAASSRAGRARARSGCPAAPRAAFVVTGPVLAVADRPLVPARLDRADRGDDRRRAAGEHLGDARPSRCPRATRRWRSAAPRHVAQVAGQGQQRVAGDAGQQRAGQRRGDQPAPSARQTK